MKELYPRLSALENRLGVRFKDPSLLVQALRHRSVIAEKGLSPLESNERLEFLGDAVLGAVVSHLLYQKYPGFQEGQLSQMRSWLVKEERLARLAQRLGLPDYIQVSQGEKKTGGPKKASILAGALEAVIGAIYLDAGYERVFQVLRAWFAKLIPQAQRGLKADYRSRLQELVQAHWKETPVYRLGSERGPSHAPSFEMEVWIRGEKWASGRGRSKKEAAQEAARKALKKVQEVLQEKERV